MLGESVTFGASFSLRQENSIRNVRQELLLHAVKVLDYGPLVEMLLDLLFGGHSRLQ